MIKDTKELKDFIIKTLDDKKATDISYIDLDGKTSLAEFMVFANGTSRKNVSALADYLSLQLKHMAGLNVGIEGMNSSEWVLLDAGSVIVHIFYPEARSTYKLEELWQQRLKYEQK